MERSRTLNELLKKVPYENDGERLQELITAVNHLINEDEHEADVETARVTSPTLTGHVHTVSGKPRIVKLGKTLC